MKTSNNELGYYMDPVQIFHSPPVVLLLFFSRIALIQQQIDSFTTGSQANIWMGQETSFMSIAANSFTWLELISSPILVVGESIHSQQLGSFSTKFVFVQSSCIRVDLLSYESKTTDKRQQNDWRTKKNLDGLDWRCTEPVRQTTLSAEPLLDLPT